MSLSCALLGGFAVNARVLMLWHHIHLMRNVSEDACTCCMADCYVVIVVDFRTLDVTGCWMLTDDGFVNLLQVYYFLCILLNFV